MNIRFDSKCIECHLRRNVSTARSLGTEEQATAFAKALMQLYLDAPDNVASPWFGPRTDDLFHQFYGLDNNRFEREKAESNRYVLARMDLIRAQVEQSEDPVYKALQFAVLGNYIDFSALQGEVSFDQLDRFLEKVDEITLDRQVYRKFCEDLQRGKTLLYVTDNAGEIGFDRICAEQIHKKYPHVQITFCVRGAFTMNDATREDAAVVGIPFPVIDNGNRIAGTQLDQLSEEAKQALETADVILAKGQANTETMLGCGYNVYFAFLIKCARFIDIFGKPKFTPMLVRELDT